MARAAAHLTAVLVLALGCGVLADGPDRTNREGSVMRLSATAYCHAGTTAAGTRTHTGIVAADPKVLPVGSVLRILEPDRFAGIYTVMDTGSGIKGHDLDIFMPSCSRAVEFGRQAVRVAVLRLGWDPKAGGDDVR
jgi:3D (Asp-Asp-Asp) domain-containing protein